MVKYICYLFLTVFCLQAYSNEVKFWNYTPRDEGLEWHAVGEFDSICEEIYGYLYKKGYKRIGDIPWHRTFESKFFWGGVYLKDGTIFQIAVVSPVFKDVAPVEEGNFVISVVVDFVKEVDGEFFKGIFKGSEGAWDPSMMMDFSKISESYLHDIYLKEVTYFTLKQWKQ